MAIKFSGNFEVKQTPDQVYDFLTDPNKFAPLLPEFQSLSVQDPSHFTVNVNVGVSYIKGTAAVKMELTQADRPSRAQYKGSGSVAGGNVSLIAGFDLSPNDVGTKVAWQGEAQVFGRLTSVAGGLLEPLGRKQVQKLIDGLQAALGKAGLEQSTTAVPEATPQAAAPTQPGPGPVSASDQVNSATPSAPTGVRTTDQGQEIA
jgi:carbon monoxide dehydrogenase subunit G